MSQHLVVVLRLLLWHDEHGAIDEELGLARVQIPQIPVPIMLFHTMGHEHVLGTAIERAGTSETGRRVQHPYDEPPELPCPWEGHSDILLLEKSALLMASATPT